jgi:glutathione S-transferase
MSAVRTFIGLAVSPFSERARWALDHHALAYRYKEHVPLLGELSLRRKVRRFSLPKATVPVLEADGEIFPSSLDIARYADRVGTKEKLFPAGAEGAVNEWNDVADALLDVGRGWVLKNLAESRAAQKESLPPFIPGFARGAFAPMTKTAALYLFKKHKSPDAIEEEVTRTVRPLLTKIRAARGPRATLLDGFSYADITVCASLTMLRPRDDAKLGPATRETWTHPALAREFDDLLAWRDDVYRTHRPERARA